MKRLLFVFVIILMISCQKDEEKSPNEISADLCANVQCLNGGTCINGICQCQQGYEGTNCGTVIIPDGFTITKVRILDYPTNNNGNSWDLTSGADLFVATGDNCCNAPSGYIQNATIPAALNVSWSSSNVYDSFTIWIVDFDDFDPNDVISGIIFIPANYSEGLPDQITVGNSIMTVQLDVNWVY